MLDLILGIWFLLPVLTVEWELKQRNKFPETVFASPSGQTDHWEDKCLIRSLIYFDKYFYYFFSNSAWICFGFEEEERKYYFCAAQRNAEQQSFETGPERSAGLTISIGNKIRRIYQWIILDWDKCVPDYHFEKKGRERIIEDLYPEYLNGSPGRRRDCIIL